MSKFLESSGSTGDLRRTLRAVERALARGLGDGGKACCGLTVSLCHALLELDGAGKSMGSLAETLDLDPSTTTRTIEDLVTLGLAERQVSATDRRSVHVKWSQNGERKAAEIDGVWNAYFQQVLAAMPEPTRAAFMESLPSFLAALRGKVAPQPSGACRC